MRRRDLEPRLRALVRRELLAARDRSAVAGARPVRVRAGADPRGRLQHARETRSQDAATSPRRAISSRSGATSSPAPWPAHYLAAHANARGGPEAEALGAQARIALQAAAERAAALGSHDQARRLPGAGPERHPIESTRRSSSSGPAKQPPQPAATRPPTPPPGGRRGPAGGGRSSGDRARDRHPGPGAPDRPPRARCPGRPRARRRRVRRSRHRSCCHRPRQPAGARPDAL